MKNLLLRTARQQRRWSQKQLADCRRTLSTIERAERGEWIRIDNIERLCTCFQKAPEQLGLIEDLNLNRREANKAIAGFIGGMLVTPSTELIDLSPLDIWTDDLLANYARGIDACQDLYFNMAIRVKLRLLSPFTAIRQLHSQKPSPLQRPAARLASQAQQLACEIATDNEDYVMAQRIANKHIICTTCRRC